MTEQIPKKERMKIPRQKMPEQDPKERSKNFKEVPFGLTEEQALIEAERCLDCPKVPCVKGCPVEVDITGFIMLIRQKDYGVLSQLQFFCYLYYGEATSTVFVCVNTQLATISKTIGDIVSSIFAYSDMAPVSAVWNR